jgi:hypothetical protein
MGNGSCSNSEKGSTVPLRGTSSNRTGDVQNVQSVQSFAWGELVHIANAVELADATRMI